MTWLHQGDFEILRHLRARSFSLVSADHVTDGGDLVLSFPSPSNIFFTGSTLGQTVTLGDARTYQTGFEYRFHNDSTVEITIRNAALTVLGTVMPGSTIVVYLEQNLTLGGIWFIGRPNVVSAPAVVAYNFTCEPTSAVLDLTVADKAVDRKVLSIASNGVTEIPQGVFGIIVEKVTPTRCNVLFRGEIGGFSGFNRGEALLVQTDGKLGHAVPTTGMVHKLGTAISSSRMIYDPIAPYRRYAG